MTSFGGTKSIVLTTSSWVGGRSLYIGVVYLAVGCVLLILSLVFFIIHLKMSKRWVLLSYVLINFSNIYFSWLMTQFSRCLRLKKHDWNRGALFSKMTLLIRFIIRVSHCAVMNQLSLKPIIQVCEVLCCGNVSVIVLTFCCPYSHSCFICLTQRILWSYC